MGHVLGIGGVFFKAADKVALRAWYARVLGVDITEWGSALFANPTQGFQQLAPFAADTDHFKPSALPFMLNLIVDDMDALVAGIEAAGETLTGREDHEYGRFAWLLDPNGLKLELWQPLGDSPV
jgi:predicted enzyme related to lactoylglutathione lyase